MTRFVVHDFSGHPFQLQLSRELARRGHSVLHLHCGSYPSGKGDTTAPDGENPAALLIESIDLAEPFDRYHPRKRFQQESSYGKLAIDRIGRFEPDVLISCNVPLFAHGRIQRWAQSKGITFVFWHQDFYGVAMREAATEKIPVVGGLAGRWMERTERKLLDTSDGVIGISDAFARRYADWGIEPGTRAIIENWAPIEELPVVDHDNDWSRRHGLADTVNLIYSGTLGLKHNPSLLTAVAETFRDDDAVRVVVVSEGMGADWLAEEKDNRGLDNLVLLPYQPYDALPSVLGAGDVLLAILESTAGGFSVPSKVLTYLCAQRALLAAIPADNLAARVIERAQAGVVVGATDTEAFVMAAKSLVEDPETRARFGRAARGYAEEAFDIVSIADRFEDVVGVAAEAGSGGSRAGARRRLL